MRIHMAAESEIQKKIRLWLLKWGILVERIQSGVVPFNKGYIHMASAGHPDLVCYLARGRNLFLEIKKPGGKVNPYQEKYHARLIELGHEVYVLYSFEEAKQLFSELNVHVADSSSTSGNPSPP